MAMSLKRSRGSWIAGSSLACLLVAGTAGLIAAQASTATLLGTIRDETGAVLPNATVKVTNNERNTSRITKTNDVGTYVFPALNPGKYFIAADLPGFRQFVQDGIVLEVNQVARIDVRLDIGVLEEIIHINSAVP